MGNMQITIVLYNKIYYFRLLHGSVALKFHVGMK